ncbi:MAG: hypothetical protein WBG30_12465 [Psychrilyobacter sp.]|uniref:hypothetical protein n=1 Tax=Psychrilyobacter sp. TaxID=2586924 RepID=UPI003C73CAD3
MEYIIKKVCLKHMKELDLQLQESKLKEVKIIEQLYKEKNSNIKEIKNNINVNYFKIKNFLTDNRLMLKDEILDNEKIQKIKNKSNKLMKNIIEGNFEKNKINKLENKFIFYLLTKEYIMVNELQNIMFKTNSELKFFLEDLSEAINEVKNKVDDKEKIQNLELEIQNLRSSLILLESEKLDFEEENEMLKEKYETQAFIDIFKNMNSEDNDYLLDNFSENNKILKTLKKEGIEIQSEVESMVISQKVFMKFLKKYEIKEVEKIGKKIEISIEETKNYDYYGSEFKDNEIKNVEIETSGWKIREDIISRPKVKELINNEK